MLSRSKIKPAPNGFFQTTRRAQDEELDHSVIDALQRKDFERLCTLPRDRLNVGPGTPEPLNWVALAAAINPVPMTLIDYQPCYRSLAGTGHGITFGVWNA